MNKKGHNKSFKPKLKISLVVSIALGFLIGMLIMELDLPKTLLKNTSNLDLIIALTILIFSFILQIILHEIGHLIFGILTGYEFISFRIGSLTIIRENKKFYLKKFSIPGTAGQCLLMPKSHSYEDTSYILYNLGGIVMNFTLGLLSIVLYKFINGHIYLNTFLFTMIITSIYFFITNGIPMKIAGMANDGYNLISVLRNNTAKYCFYIQLKTSGLLNKGIRLKDMPLEWFKIDKNSDFSNPLISSIKCLEGNYYHDRLEFHKAKECYEFLIDYNPKIIELLENEIKCELLFYEILDRNYDRIYELYTVNLKSYIKATNSYISRKRLMYAYTLLIEKDTDKSNKILYDIEKLKKTYPSKGELKSELEIINFIKNNRSILSS